MDHSFTPIQDIGEFGLIDRFETLLGEPADPDLIQSIGDDAAVYRVAGKEVQVVASDGLIEGVHFDLSFMPMEHLGAKSITINISDIVAMNAEPKYATIVIGVPQHVSIEMMEDFYRGVKKVCDAYGTTVIGGDLTAARQFSISVTLIGVAKPEDVVYRRGARVGDLLCVTGDVGAAYAGLKILIRERLSLQEKGEDYTSELDAYRYVVNRNLAPTAKLGLTRKWREAGVRPTAMIDLSDGLASEVNHLCSKSDCGAVVRIANIPIHTQTSHVAQLSGEDVAMYALNGGEDYELVFALDPVDYKKLDHDDFSVIGEFTESREGVVSELMDGSRVPLEATGWNHFSGSNGAGNGEE